MILVFNTWWFWICAVEVLALFIAIAYDSGKAATASVFLTLAILYWGLDIDYITYFKTHPMYLLYGIIAYFPIGVIWSALKWFILALDKRKEYKEFKVEFLKSNNLTLRPTVVINEDSVNAGVISNEVLSAWNNRVYARERLAPPTVKEYKYSILLWLGYWPISLVWSLLNDFITRIAKTIYNFIYSKFQYISDKVFSDFKSDFK